MSEQPRPPERDDAVEGPGDGSLDGLVGAPIDALPGPTRVPPMPPAGPIEIGGPGGLEPTRYGDWERNGRCCDF